MTADQPKRDAKSEFPALREFFPGYLHQDFREEYGSAAGAAKAFRKDASDAEIEAVQREWRRWRAGLKNSPADEIAKALRQLGSSWQPENPKEMDSLEKAIIE